MEQHTDQANSQGDNGKMPSENGLIAHKQRQPVGNLREIFWQNVIREMLTSLSMTSMKLETQRQAERLTPGTVIIDTPTGIITQGSDDSSEPADSDDSDNPDTEGAQSAALFDGRLAVITTLGTRIPIADVHPLFACGVTQNSGERELASAVECSVFQISTPSGEVYTLPLSEIRGFHSLSPDLINRLQQEAEMQMNHFNGNQGEETDQPFGFAAFTSLAKAERENDDSETDRS